MIKICHASIDENGKARGGIAGDQTSKEVCVRTWYNKPWDLMLRHPNESIAYSAANIAQLLAESNLVGYDQNERNTLHKLLRAVDYNIPSYIYSGVKSETDCSAFVTVCFLAAGVKTLEYNGNAPTTSTMEKVFKQAGFEVYKQSRYLSSDAYLKKGDVLVKAGSHTVICIESGQRVNQLETSSRLFNIPPKKLSSIVDALALVGADGSKEYRKKIWEVNELGSVYVGSAPQNQKLLKLLYDGTLIMP